jgi:D-threonate/D-erythronate kinase
MPVQLGIIADDLTGANDTGVQFARFGARTIVPLDLHDLASLRRRADVLVLSTDSRGDSPAVAAHRAKVAAQALKRARVPAVYKKIDSTFRGNIGAELDAILDVYPTPLAFISPTFPPAGRAVQGGILTVHGVPVHRTSIGRDPVAPVRQSHLPTLLRAQSRRPIHLLALEILRARSPQVFKAMAGWVGRESALVVVDAATPMDLRRLVRLITAERLPRVVAGAAGLAGALGRTLRWPRHASCRLARIAQPILVVVGSPNPTSIAQLAELERRGTAPVIRVEPREALAGPERFRKELDRVLGKAAPELAAGHHVALTLAQDGIHPPQRSAASRGRATRLAPSASVTLSEFLGRAARDLRRRTSLGALVLCGGDIALATCRALRADGIILGGEVQAGVPWGRLVGGECPDLPVVTKAGGFGTPEVFCAALRFLQGRAHR